ncbi:MAG: hypothetical protein A2790_13500 [Phenylobacterium sp. RIFCSPHIGHO2_01_FULL_69_31]|uniref:amine dehydrogenase large subunit n=1 Tax=unclassified Phenylobacterium TaxID=2640670 RepID=UPI0008B1406F|nr:MULTISPECIES: amine dehydrogenase large subunit [unclassified Phenylobacterium]OHB26872.1 MAG: hypothetical protein A2790_13500 [Phenylobacterium sp. RIFCSPHIGHO2_01_FULL_69_31]TAJ69375.1 MAG: hypothetical protein EPO51_22970 [Phenylobacterium sp.]
MSRALAETLSEPSAAATPLLSVGSLRSSRRGPGAAGAAVKWLVTTLGGGVLPAAIAFASGPVVAQEPLPPEQLTVESALKPGPNVLINHGSWNGAGSVNIYSADDLSYKANITVGLNGQVVVARGGGAAYVVSTYPKRIMSGPAEVVFRRYDLATLKPGAEILVSEKYALTQTARGIVELTASNRFALVQNATPATSVTVIDLNAGKSVAEAPTPGCWSIIPSASGDRFSTLCGDGTLMTVKLGPNGRPSGQAYSEQIFDAQKDPLFTHVQRDSAGNLIFVSYSGVVYRVSDAGDAPRLIESFKMTSGGPRDWAPGGYEITAYNAANDVLFVLMHSGATDGSHKHGSEEIWAVDMKSRQVLYRSPAASFTHLAVTADKTPTLFAVSRFQGRIVRFEVDPTAKFAAKPTHSIVAEDAAYVTVP